MSTLCNSTHRFAETCGDLCEEFVPGHRLSEVLRGTTLDDCVGHWGQLRVVTLALRKWDNCLLAKTWSDWILLDQCPLGQFLPLTVVAFAKLFAKTSQHSTGCSRLLTRLAVGKRALARSTCKISRRNLGFHVSPGAMIYQDIYHQQLKLLYVSMKSYLHVYTASSALLEHADLISFATLWSKGRHTRMP